VYGNNGWPFLEENCYHVVQEALLEKQEEEEKLQLQVLQKKKQQQQEEEEEEQQQQDDDEEEAQVSSLYLYFPVLIFVDVIVQCVTLTIYARLCCFSWQ
jgi:uncharacterized membrane protein YdbT with pleckstrin-like domain